MIQINLLPWRQQARLAKKKRLITTSVFFGVFTLFIFLVCHIYIGAHLSEAEELTNYLQAQINQEQTVLNNMSNEEQERNKVKTQLLFVKDMILNNYHTVAMLNELVKVVPSNININRVIRNKNSIILAGFANTDEDITQFIQSLAKSSYFIQPNLNVINQQNTTGHKDFEIVVEEKGSKTT